MTENFNENIYDEMDNFAAEVLEGDKFINYINTENKFFKNQEETIEEVFSEDFKNGVNNDISFDDFKKSIGVYGDFYYYYLQKFSNCLTYYFGQKGYTKGFYELIKKNGLEPENLNIKWEDIETKEEKYKEGLVDILYAMLEYELKKIGYSIFGLNLGFDSVLYYVVPEEKYNRITQNQKMFKIFNLEYLETIYNEIFEVTGDLGVKGLEIGDFVEKKDDGYYTLFSEEKDNVVVKEIDEDDENQVKIIL